MTRTDTTTDENVKAKLIAFFNELKSRGIIKSVVKDLGDELAILVMHNGYRLQKGQTEPKAESFKHFDVKDAKNCPSSVNLCETIVSVLPMVKLETSRTEQIGPIYTRVFDRPFDIAGAASGYPLFRRHDDDTPNAKAKLDGDYLMFRMERRLNADQKPTLRVSRNFLRFFPHGQRGLRFMMLSMFAARDYHGAKGWVDNLDDRSGQQRYLCSGQIVDRSDAELAGEVVHGGMTTIVVEAARKSPFVITRTDPVRGYLIEAAPTLHLRAMHYKEPSIARGYLVRCHGAEHLGGTPEGTAAQRYQDIRELQDRFSEQSPGDLHPGEAAETLHQATGMCKSDFFDPKEGNGWPSGLLVNLPFSGEPEDEGNAWPLSLPPLKGDVPEWARNRKRQRRPKNKFGIYLDLARPNDV